MNMDVLIVGGRVVDGSGNPWFYADVALSGDTVAAIAPPGHLPRENAREVVEAAGKVVCPGFIDIQSHSLTPFLRDGRAVSKVTQGVTTEILGELWTPAPLGGRRDTERIVGDLPSDVADEARTWNRFGDWIGTYERRGVSVNVGSFVGGGTVREWACGWDAGDPTPEQMEAMRRVTAEAMEDGAFGIAPALIYAPSSYSPDEELTECARVVGKYGGVYIVHLRSEGDGLLDSIEANVRLSREAECPVEVYHLKASGERNWPKMPDAIAAIDRARAEGVDITADMYPYVASGTGLSVLVPLWAMEGGRLFDNLRDPDARRRIHDEMIAPKAATGDFAAERRAEHVVPLGFQREENRPYIGRTLDDIATERGQDWADAAIDLLLSENQRIATVFFSMSEENVRLQLKQPWVKISTDAGGIDPEGQTNPVHPRGYGTYPRVLGKYVREEGVLTLEDAVRKMTSSVADRLRLRRRGLLREAFYADVVIFDPATVSDRATFTDPHQLSVGIEEVWVNGGHVIQGGKHTGAKPGRTVFGPGRS
jgi:N-acyl-D-aspartate/D-glutamate deacylase